MTTLSPAFQSVPEYIQDDVEHRRKLAQMGNRHNQGKFNAFIDFTLTASAATSTLIDARIGYFSTLLFMPMTANASAEIGAGTIYVQQSNMKSGQAIINHANNSNADKTFRILIIG